MHQQKRTAERFNPFEDRLSRDIRNSLSVSIIEVIKSRSLSPAERTAEKYSVKDLAPIYRDYIQTRLKRYNRALAQLSSTDENIVKLAGVLWDLGLYFEVHEILEPEWIQATGDTKLLLQALIRAAGVYINLELGYKKRAAKIAAKTTPVLRQFQNLLRQDLQVDRLIVALEQLSDQPPLLLKQDG